MWQKLGHKKILLYIYDHFHYFKKIYCLFYDIIVKKKNKHKIEEQNKCFI